MIKSNDYLSWIGEDIAVTITCHLAGHKLFVAGALRLRINSNLHDNSNTCGTAAPGCEDR
jgi:hypothetical protein